MKPNTKAAALAAVKWAAGLSAGIILGPIVIALAGGTAAPGKLVAEKLIVGIVQFPILFFSLWAWGALSKKNPVTGTPLASDKMQTETPTTTNKVGIFAGSETPSKWNYVGVAAGTFMLLLLFLPQIISGPPSNQEYLSAAFWVGVIIYSALNIIRARK